MQNLMAECILGGVVVAGAVTDLERGQIPNWLTLPAMTAGLILNSVAGVGFEMALWGMLGAAGIYFLFFAMGFRGAGDGKLMGAVGAFVGWPQIATVIVVVALLAGAAGLALAWQKGALPQVLRNVVALLADIFRLRWRAVRERSDFRAPSHLRMPHGPVIAAGTLVVLVFFPR